MGRRAVGAHAPGGMNWHPEETGTCEGAGDEGVSQLRVKGALPVLFRWRGSHTAICSFL